MTACLDDFLGSIGLGGLSRETSTEYITGTHWDISPVGRVNSTRLLPAELLSAFASAAIQPPPKHHQILCSSMRKSNMAFSVAQRSSHDSQVSYRGPGGSIRLGRILHILCEPKDGDTVSSPQSIGRILVIIERYRPLSPADQKKDIYWNHPLIGEKGYQLFRVVYDEFLGALDVVDASELVGHIARCPLDLKEPVCFERAAIVTAQVDRVRTGSRPHSSS